MLVTDADIEKFDQDGAIVLRNVFSDDWVQKVKEGIQINLATPSKYSEKLALKEGQGAYFNDYCNWKTIQQFKDFAFNSPAAEIASGKFEVLSWACEPGDCVVFHGMTVHGAKGNSSSSLHRRVLSTRWVGEGTKIAKRP